MAETITTKVFQASQKTEKKYEGFENVFIANSGGIDSDGECIKAGAFDLSRYNENPVVFYQHYGYHEPNPDYIIARGKVWAEGDKLMLGITEYDENSELAVKVKEKVKNGFLNAVSVGFRPRDGKTVEVNGKSYWEFTDAELLEISIVNLPADPKAVRVKKVEKPDEETWESKANEVELADYVSKRKRANTIKLRKLRR